MTGPVPSRFSVRAKSSAYSKAARMVPTHAAPISAAVQLNAAATTRLPCRPGSPIRLSAGPRTLSKHARGHHASVAELVVHVDHGDARSGSRHGDHGERVVGARVGIGAADDGVQLTPGLVPPGAVGRVVLLAGEHPLVTVTAGDRLDAGGGVTGVEVRAPADVGEGVGGQQVALGVIGERPQEALLLLRGAVLDHRLEAEPGSQQRRRDVDIDARELLGREREVEHREARPAVLGRDKGLREPGMGHLAIRLSASEERLPSVGGSVDGLDRRPEHSLGERLRVLLQLLLTVAQGEVDGHGSPSLWGSGSVDPTPGTRHRPMALDRAGRRRPAAETSRWTYITARSAGSATARLLDRPRTLRS